MDSSRTITELKSSFIRSQIRVLSESLSPQEGWRAYSTESENLSDKATDEVLQKLNGILKQHHRVVYSSQAIHHVASQIESLYLTSLIQDVQGLGPSSASEVEKGTDLSKHVNIERLPMELENEYGEDGKKYEQLRARLSELDRRRQQQKQRLARYKQLAALLEPFKDPQRNIQPNLIIRDGELGQELDQMRILVARVADQIGQSKLLQRDESAAFSPKNPDEKVIALLDMIE